MTYEAWDGTSPLRPRLDQLIDPDLSFTVDKLVEVSAEVVRLAQSIVPAADIPLIGIGRLDADTELDLGGELTPCGKWDAYRDDNNFFDGETGVVTINKAGVYEVFSNCRLTGIDNQGTRLRCSLVLGAGGLLYDGAGMHIAPWSNDPEGGKPFSATSRFLLTASIGDTFTIQYSFQGGVSGTPAVQATYTTVFIREIPAQPGPS